MYKKMYYQLFNAITNALEALAQRNYGQAEQLLRDAQQASEEFYLKQDTKDSSACS